MSPFPSIKRMLRLKQQNASVLLITLGFVLLITVITVAFLVRSRSSLQTSQSYTKEIAAQEIGEIAINSAAAHFQKEITDLTGKNQPAPLLPNRDTVSEKDPRKSALVWESQGNLTTSAAGIVSTDTAAKNGWKFDKSRWETAGLLRKTGNATQTFTSPNWEYVYNFGSNATSDVVGRYAVMAYDVGGLIDINEAGLPSSVSLGDKGSVAFADLSVLSSDLATELPKWRYNGTTPTTDTFYGNSTATDPAQAGRIEAPKEKVDAGENRFFSRMELVEAAKNNKMGLTEYLLPFLRIRSVAANRISVADPVKDTNTFPNVWRGGLFADGSTTPLKLSDSQLAATKDTEFPVTRIDGTVEKYTIKKGEPLIRNRFPLSRLRLLAERDADGTPRHPEEIKKYFGLTWDISAKDALGNPSPIFVYTSPDGNNAINHIKTLIELVAQINQTQIGREPDFFEWLKAAIDPGSLGQTGGTTDRRFEVATSVNGKSGEGPVTPWEISKDLHVLRIGANIIDQSDPDSIPTGIRSFFTGVDVRGIASDPNLPDSYGVENLPYLNEVIASVFRSGDDLNGYLQFEMWNPHQNASIGSDYEGKALSSFRIRAVRGSAVFQPFVFVNSRKSNSLYKYPIGSKKMYTEDYNPPAVPLRYIVDTYKKTPPSQPLDLTDKTIEFTCNTGILFSEPYIATYAGEDTKNPATMPSGPVVLGEKPVDLVNALKVCTVNAKNPAFTKVKRSDIYVHPDDPLSGQIKTDFETPSGDKAYNAAHFYSNTSFSTKPITFALEVKYGNAWHTYQVYNNLSMSARRPYDPTKSPGDTESREHIILSEDNSTVLADTTATLWAASSDTINACFSNWLDTGIRKGFPNVDPRTERFGLTDQMQATPGAGIRSHINPWSYVDSIGSIPGISINLPAGGTSKPGSSFDGTTPAKVSWQPPATGWTFVAGSPNPSYAVLADLASNSGADAYGGSKGAYSYKDPDGTLRSADARWAIDNDKGYHPALPTTKAKKTRPIVLNRPYRSVAELGVVFRDVPWKSLDLSSPESADRRLLDVFCVEDRATTTGKINPVLATSDILSALLSGASLDPSNPSPSSVLSQGTAAAVANDLISRISYTGNYTIDEGSIAKVLAESATTRPGGGFSPYKIEVENFLRALSSTTDTRSWQLMLDVVAQSGRIAPQSTSSKDFVVEGQKRFFVYLTLDRITGEIVDKHIEPVYE